MLQSTGSAERLRVVRRIEESFVGCHYRRSRLVWIPVGESSSARNHLTEDSGSGRRGLRGGEEKSLKKVIFRFVVFLQLYHQPRVLHPVRVVRSQLRKLGREAYDGVRLVSPRLWESSARSDHLTRNESSKVVWTYYERTDDALVQ